MKTKNLSGSVAKDATTKMLIVGSQPTMVGFLFQGVSSGTDKKCFRSDPMVMEV
jgi:hypothetical protein